MRGRAVGTVLATIALSAALTACSGEDTSLDLTGSWVLTSGSGPAGDIAPVSGSPITLTVEGERVSGSDGCNSLTGTVTVDGDSVRFSQLAVTERACLDENVMAAASSFDLALGEVDRGVLDEDGLALFGDEVALEFEKDQ